MPKELTLSEIKVTLKPIKVGGLIYSTRKPGIFFKPGIITLALRSFKSKPFITGT